MLVTNAGISATFDPDLTSTAFPTACCRSTPAACSRASSTARGSAAPVWRAKQVEGVPMDPLA
ncbi:hypothetical protein F9C11_14340 [Amycolatopsis sp. VS8301801F10]|uniref:hypothetical protein n=1 Tax=Amycolatopsis sp. VS8301801F10 TaxID=2652442 RepID=UPI0038FCD758